MKISVVIPAFDVEPWLAKAIESAVGQDPPPHEVIVVDDGSTDATAEVALTYPSVRILQSEHRGVAAARNAGAAEATGNILLFLDADDALLPGAISVLSAAASRAKDWAAVIPNYVPMQAGGRPAWTRHLGERIVARDYLGALIRENQFAANALVRRETWQRYPFKEELFASEDWDFWLRLLLAGERLVLLGQPLVYWRVRRSGSLTGKSVLMRHTRRRVLESLSSRSDLTLAERLILARQLIKTSAGEAAARVAEGEGLSRARGHLLRSPSSLVRATGMTLGVPGLVPILRALDTFRHRL